MPEKDPCSKLAATITRLAMNIGTRPEMRHLDDVVGEMQKHLPGITRSDIVNSINEATAGNSRTVTDLQKKLSDLRREARRDKTMRESIDTLQKHLDEGTLPPKTDRTSTPTSPSMVPLQESLDAVRSAIAKSEPAIKEKYEKQIAELSDRLESGVFAPREKKADPLASPEVERLRYKRDRLRAEINQRIEDLKPRSFWGQIQDPLHLARAVMTSLDLSAVLRQGGFIAIGHPVRALKAFPEMFKALASDQKAHAINAAILERPNAPLYARSNLYLAPYDSLMATNKQEEMFLSRILERSKNSRVGKVVFAPVHASERAYITFLNKLRADSFDTMAATLGRNHEVTLPEASAISNFINVATGRGHLGPQLEKAAQGLNAIFFAPRYLTSRFELLAKPITLPFDKTPVSTKKLVAQEYARTLVGLGTMYALAKAAGAELEFDSRSSDFGKIKVGNTRIDPLMGLSQSTVLLSRLATGQIKHEDGDVSDIRGPRHMYGETTGTEVIGNFLRGKLAPIPSAMVNLASGKDMSGNDATATTEAKRSFTPIVFNDIMSSMQEQGVEKGTALSLLAILGMGVQNYAAKDPYAPHKTPGQKDFDRDKAELKDKLKKQLQDQAR